MTHAVDGRTTANQLYAELGAVVAENPAARRASFGSLASAHQFARLYALTERHVPHGADVLDWGCGSGHFSYFLAKAGYQVTAFSLFGCPLATELETRFGSQFSFVQGTPENPSLLPFGDESFDAVFSVGVLEHVRETGGRESASVGEIARVLRGGGVFLTYHLPNRWSYIEVGVRLLTRCYHHPYRYTRAQITSLCADAGLEVPVLRRYGIVPRNSLARLPGVMKRSSKFAAAVDTLDGALSSFLGAIAQNHLFVARKA